MLRETQSLRRKLEKQQKEMEMYKRIAEMNLKDGEEFKNEMCNHRCILKSDLEENYIPKEAIREKIKEIETKIYYKNGYYDAGAKMILKELLGE